MSGIMLMALGNAVVASGPNANLPASLLVYDLEYYNTATAGFSLFNTGNYDSNGNQSAPSGVWKTGTGLTSDYEVLATLISGSLSTGIVGSWLNLGTSRIWTLNAAPAGTYLSAQLQLQIRNASTLTVYTTSNLTLTAYYAPFCCPCS